MSGSGGGCGPAAGALLETLRRGGWGEVEVFEKQGRSRRFERGPEGESATFAEESGWAVRAGDLRRSLFVAGSGAPPAAPRLPEPTAHPLRLPDPRPIPAWPPPPGLDAPLIAESEAWGLFAAVEREVRRELPAARLVAARLEDGASEAALRSSRGVAADLRSRATQLRLEVEAEAETMTLEIAAREPRALAPHALARRIVDRWLARRPGGPPPGADLVLAAPLAARLIQALAPLFSGPEAGARLAASAGAARQLAGESWTLIDDGRLAAGALAAPADGEGLPTGPRVLLEAGRFVAPLVAWWECDGEPPPGCARRASYRDLPRRAPTQLYLAPAPQVAPAELVASIAAGAYLIEAEGGVAWEPGGRFRLPVSGFAIQRGRASGPLGRAVLGGDLRGLFGGLCAVARDLAFVAGDGLYGAPSVAVRGLTLTPA